MSETIGTVGGIRSSTAGRRGAPSSQPSPRQTTGARWRPVAARAILPAAIGLAALAIYLRTLAASITWGDGPELTVAAFDSGVPHPTGYPLYMLISHLFLHACHLGSVAHRMNLLSALSASGAIALLFLLLRRFTHSRLLSLVAALMFAFSRTFWSQAVIAEVYAFHMLLATALLVGVLAWEQRGEPRWLGWAALLFGLCLCHHGMSVLMVPGLLYFVLTSRHRGAFGRSLRWTLPLCLLPLCLYAYLPLAAWRDPAIDWGDPRHWSSFVGHITGRQYHHAMFTLTRKAFSEQVRDYLALPWGDEPGYLFSQFGALLLCLAPLGAWSLARRQRRLFGLTLLIYLASAIYALNYYIADVYVYYLPSHLMLAIWIACGLRHARSWIRSKTRRAAPGQQRPLRLTSAAALAMIPVFLVAAHVEANDLHDDWIPLVFARAALVGLKPNAVLLCGENDYYFALLYTHVVERRRPDVTLVNEHDAMRPERLRLITRLAAQGLTVRVPACTFHEHAGPELHNCLVKRLVEDNIDHRPVYVLARPAEIERPWLAEVLAPYYCVDRSNLLTMELSRSAPSLGAVRTRPRSGKRVVFGRSRPASRLVDGITLIGYDAQPFSRGGVPWLRLNYDWQVMDQALARDAKVWVIFTDAAGNYARKGDGSPEFENIHPLAYGASRRLSVLPSTFRETFELSVPPGEWEERFHVRVAVAQGDEFLPCAGDGSRWAEVGELSTVVNSPAAVRTASTGPPSRPEE